VIVENAWKLIMEARGGKVVDAVKGVAVELWDWSKNILGDLEKRIKHVKKELEKCRRGELSAQHVAREQLLKYKLEKLDLEDQMELYWKQRAKVHWLEKRDRNTYFFHRYASERRRSRISRLVREDGEVVMEAGDIHDLITNYYKSLFQSNAGTNYGELTQQVPRRVTQLMNHDLLKPFEDEEIKQALQSIGDLKAPGSDGMPSLFLRDTGMWLGRMC